ncbi:elongation factor 1-beta [Candidatus Woesearchaeota archaeon]|nr:elongation factor 1-beta [Candidatus Woesearchaeota archaeon]
MTRVIVTLKIMPESPELSLDAIHQEASSIIEKFGFQVAKHEIEPIAFGLNALKIIYIQDEAQGGTEPVEKKVSAITGVQSVEVTDVRRAIG